MPHLIVDLALILVTAGVVTIVFKKLKQPLVLGYIMAGFIVSPNLPFTVTITDGTNIKIWSDIGVMFLLFALGLDFSFKKILKMGMAPVIAAVTIVAAMMLLGIMESDAFDWPYPAGLFVAGMLAMSSTTIIYKAFDDLGLKQQQFSALVMSVLILEDIIAIVLMVVLTTVAKGNPASSSDGGMAGNILNIVFFLVLWFVVGMFFIPLFLRKVRSLINDEVLLIVALALCCAMAVGANAVGFSPAFGSFVMGSILAETIEGKKIEKLVTPVKNLFGAIFFVSVGMLVDVNVVAEQWFTILVLVMTIIGGQCLFGTFGFMLAGEPLKTAMRCGFSMAQIGEFAFIIAGLGLSLHVMPEYMYPVIVTVSVVTTFLTPYMIRGAVPAYGIVEKYLPKSWIRQINKISEMASTNVDDSQGNWKPLLKAIFVNTLIYSVLAIAVMVILLTEGKWMLNYIIPNHIAANVVCAVITTLLVSPFLRAFVMKKNKSEEFKALWYGNVQNRAPLVFTIMIRVTWAMILVGYVYYYLFHISLSLIICLAATSVIGMICSNTVKKCSIQLERLFKFNLMSKDIAARAHGEKRPLFENKLLDHNIHIATIDIPQTSMWGGRNLRDLKLGQRFGVSVSSIIRGDHRINIPSGDNFIFPLDQLNIIGTDQQLASLNEAVQKEIFPEPVDYWAQDMQLKRLVVTETGKFIGQTLVSSNLRNMYSCMIIGKENHTENLSKVTPDYIFQKGDTFWFVGEKQDLDLLSKDM